MKSRQHSFIATIFNSFILPCVILLLLWTLEALHVNTSLILPYPHEVFKSLAGLIKTSYYWQLLSVSTLRVLKSFCISFILSIILGLFAGKYTFVRQLFSFPMSIIKATPVVSFILMAIFWFNTNSVPVFIGVLMTLPVMVGGVISGIKSIDKALNDMCSVYNLTFLQRLSFFYLPSIAPYVIEGAVTSFSLTWKVVVASEVIALPQISVGFALQSGKVQLETARVFAWTISIVLVSFILENIVSFLLQKMSGIKGNPNHIIITDKNELGSYTPNTCITSNPMVSVNVQNISITRGFKCLYKNFSVSFKPQVTAFIAPSGAGKTTLFNCIAGLFTPDAGTISKKTGIVSYLFQEPRLLPTQTVLQNITLPLIRTFGPTNAQKRSLYYLQKVGLISKVNSLPAELSGGEKQRVALARAFAYPSDILLMDEAFQSQDIRLKLQLGKLFKTLLADEPKTVIMITHDIREAIDLSDRVLVLDESPLKIKLDQKIRKDVKVKNPSFLWQLEQQIIAILS